MTDINARYNIVKRENRCFVCLKKNHRSRECRLKYTCIKCNKNHNIALCPQKNSDIGTGGNNNNGEKKLIPNETKNNVVHLEIIEENQQHVHAEQKFDFSIKNEEKSTNVLLGNDSTNTFNRDEIILQSALAEVSDTNEKRSSNTCILFDGGSQRTYLTDRLRNRLQLRCIRKEKLILKRFGCTEGVLKCLDVVQVCLKGKNGIKVYMEALCVPQICSALKVPSISWVKNNYQYLEDVDIVNPPTDDHEVDILVGSYGKNES